MAGGMFDKLKRFLSLEDDYEDVSEDGSVEASAQETQKTAVHKTVKGNRANLVALPATKAPAKQEIVVLDHVRKDGITAVADLLRQNKCIVINLVNADKDLRQRTVDFLSGISFATAGQHTKIGEGIYVFAPESMVINVMDSAQSEAGDDSSPLPPAPASPSFSESRGGYPGGYRR